jgi:hypothetical protein
MPVCSMAALPSRKIEIGHLILEAFGIPYVTADEVKKALTLKAAFSTMLDQMQ